MEQAVKAIYVSVPVYTKRAGVGRSAISQRIKNGTLAVIEIMPGVRVIDCVKYPPERLKTGRKASKTKK